MAISIVQRSFGAGELDPKQFSRVDQVKYSTGLRTLRNGYVMKGGGIQSKPGTKFVSEVKDSTKRVRLFPFILSNSVAFIIEFGDQYIRFYKNGAPVLLPAQAISAVTIASPGVFTYVGADTYANGDEIYASGFVGTIGNLLNGRNFKIANVNTGANTFELTYMDGTPVNTTRFNSHFRYLMDHRKH
jgi:hypothetical protein